MGRPRLLLGSVVLALGCNGATQTDEATSSTETSDETGEPGFAEVELVFHPNQPMIVDVLVTLAEPGFASLTHLDDPGVRVVRLDGDGPATEIHLRVRGLLPNTGHTLELQAGLEPDSPTTIEPLEFTTIPARPGFIAVFPLELNSATEVDPDYRLFDLQPLYTSGVPGMFMVDRGGRTRWHFGLDEPLDIVTIPDAFVGIELRADGTVLAMRRNAALIYDELGTELVRVSAGPELGVEHFHHDLIELPNGNFMTFTWDFQDVDYGAEGVVHVAGDVVVEFTPAGELVWTWNTFDHLDPQRRRAGFDGSTIVDPETQQPSKDWTHANGVVYADGVVYVSLRHQDWILAIDHASGELLWKLGDEGDFTLAPNSTWFFHQHSPQWQPDGSLLLYDNGYENPELPPDQEFSHAARYTLDFDAMVADRVWTDDDEPFISGVAGDANRTSNGHVLRLDTTYGGVVPATVPSRLRELDPQQNPNAIWSLGFPLGLFAYRAVPTTRLVGEPE